MKINLNLIIPIICAIMLGYLCASFIFNEYGTSSFAFNEYNTFFLQCGVYDNKDTSEKEIDGITDKITVQENNKYYSYIGMTSSYEIAKEIQNMYKEKGIDIYIKTKDIKNTEFLDQLSQYDVLLRSSNTIEEVNSVLKVILATYEELLSNY